MLWIHCIHRFIVHIWQFPRYLCNLRNDVLLAKLSSLLIRVKGLENHSSAVPTCVEHYIFLLPDFISDLREGCSNEHWLIRVISQYTNMYTLLWEIGRVATHTLSHPSSAVRGTLLAAVPMNCVASCLLSSALHKQSVSFIQCGYCLSKHPHVMSPRASVSVSP